MSEVEEQDEDLCQYLVIVDVQDIFFAIKKEFGQEFGQDCKIDFGKFKSFIHKLVNEKDEKQFRFIAYVVTNSKSDGFVRALRALGYEVVLRRRRASTKPVKLSINMALDVQEEIYTNEYLEHVYIASSDDFIIPLMRYAKNNDVKVTAVYPKGCVLNIVRRVVDSVEEITAEVLLENGN